MKHALFLDLKVDCGAKCMTSLMCHRNRRYTQADTPKKWTQEQFHKQQSLCCGLTVATSCNGSTPNKQKFQNLSVPLLRSLSQCPWTLRFTRRQPSTRACFSSSVKQSNIRHFRYGRRRFTEIGVYRFKLHPPVWPRDSSVHSWTDTW